MSIPDDENRGRNVNIQQLLRLIFLWIVAGSLLVGCGGGTKDSSPTTKILQGVFLDAAVEGLRYKTKSQVGLTDSKGTFRYQTNERVSFYVGDILIGSAKAADILTPINLVEGATSESDSQVTNILRFLQSVDEDRNLGNGISISAATVAALKGQTLDFAASENDFELAYNVISDSVLGGKDLVDASAAREHFRNTLNALNTDTDNKSYSWGKVTISGMDTNILGKDLIPSGKPTVTSAQIVWTHGDTNPAGVGLWRSVEVAMTANQIKWLHFAAVDGRTAINTNPDGNKYDYVIYCQPIVAEACNSITLDTQGKKLTLDKVQLEVGNPYNSKLRPKINNATSAIVVDGSLSWP